MKFVIMTQPTIDCVDTTDWQSLVAQGFNQPKDLLEYVNLGHLWHDNMADAHQTFRTRVPLPFAKKINKGDINDPLLRQVLPLGEELEKVEGFIIDPLGERQTNPQRGVVHKYHGRVLVIFTGACAINCRYCFRRHFPYAENQLSSSQLNNVLDYLAENPEIEEVILSGGDPLFAPDNRLSEFCQHLNDMPQITRLRIHSRIPVVLPQRITPALVEAITWPNLDTVMVVHCNHAQELGSDTQHAFSQLRTANIHLLNQAVLLNGINDTSKQQIALNKKLFNQGVMPYYLHLLDKVDGAAHFDTQESAAKDLMVTMRNSLPGYLVPKLVREQAGEKSKTIVLS